MDDTLKIIDFRVTKFSDWVREHRGHDTEEIVGLFERVGYKFIKCNDCNEVYFLDVIKDE